MEAMSLKPIEPVWLSFSYEGGLLWG